MSTHHIGEPPTSPHRILALYKFLPLEDLESLKSRLRETLLSHSARGTILLSEEGVNGTICYPFASDSGSDALLKLLQEQFPDLRVRISSDSKNVFYRLKVKIKSEIVTLGLEEKIDPSRMVVGEYVKPGPDWNALLEDKDCLVVDVRNEYEVRLGSFQGAVNPHTDHFTQFPAFLSNNATKANKIAMFCTGGIRCEKSTSLAKEMYPDKEIYHLEGGILGYLDTVPISESMFHGECYVFDKRVAVKHGLECSTSTEACFACRQPLSQAEREHEKYKKGVTCPYCVDELTEKRRERLEQRNRQIQLAKEQGMSHIHDKKYCD